MKTFVIFDRKTGEIMQTHVQMDDLHRTPEELVKIARPEARSEDIDVMVVEGLSPDTKYKVDVKAKKLTPVEESKAPGAGGAFVRPADGDPSTARTVVFQMSQKKQ
jgi:hypothetical protein